MAYQSITISDESWQDLCNIGNGTFAPLSGFLGANDYISVVNQMRLTDGSPWTVPITLEVPPEQADTIKAASTLVLLHESGEVGELDVEDVFCVDLENDLYQVFGTTDRDHPGVNKEASRSPYRVGGTVRVTRYVEHLFPEYSLTPAQTRDLFRQKGWKTVAGFQTRNPPHRAHEHLHRVGMEVTDGLLIHPLIGWKKVGDFTPRAVMDAYREMVEEFYPAEHAALAALWTPMRYAGPREAVFHAIIRRNHGCTHFIVGRDHAGVGNYYGKYAAHELCRQFTDLGIEILTLCGPYYCSKCGCIVTEKSCRHGDQHTVSVSGTEMRAMLKSGTLPPADFMRPEVSEILVDLGKQDELFVAEYALVD